MKCIFGSCDTEFWHSHLRLVPSSPSIALLFVCLFEV